MDCERRKDEVKKWNEDREGEKNLRVCVCIMGVCAGICVYGCDYSKK